MMAARLSLRLSSIHHLAKAAVVAAAIIAAPAIAPSSVLAAPEVPMPDVENAKFQFEGVLTRPEFVQAGPGENFYPTTKLEAGTKVVVVGSKNNWLKILPPAGSYSYVPKAFIQQYGDGKQGKATSQMIVRAGSSLQTHMWVAQSKLEKGDNVQILGDEEQYFKIKPPVGAYLYIATSAVKPGAQVVVTPKGEVKPVETVAAPTPETPAVPVPTPPAPPAAPATTAPTATEVTAVPVPAFANADATPASPTTAPTTTPTLTADPTPTLIEPARPINPPAKPLSATEAVTKLQSLEKLFAEASQQPLADQPLTDLQAGYEQVGQAEGITEMTKRIVDSRLGTIKVRIDSRDQLAKVDQSRKSNADRLKAQQAEHQEIKDQIKKVEMRSYAAAGTIRPSSLQVARTPIFRLTDPQTGRTLAYIWGTDPKIAASEGQFVAVRGQVATDARFNFKVITPSAVDTVDPEQLHTAYAADISPPSLIKSPTATTIVPE